MKQNKKIIILICAILIILSGLVIYILKYQKNTHYSLSVTSQPDRITFEFQNKKYTTPFSIRNLASGNYSIKAYKNGWDFQELNFYLAPNEKKEMNIVLEKKGWTENQVTEGAPLENLSIPSLDDSLPHETDHFKISLDAQQNSYLIVPQIPFNGDASPTDQLQQYWSQYYQYGVEALNWIKSKGIDPATLKIEWWAHDWWPAGKTIP
jgi:hypothetical protein